MCRAFIQSYFLKSPEDNDDEEEEAETEASPDSGYGRRQPDSWRYRLSSLNHRLAMAMGLQEN
jgi:hypothetical protein